MREDSMKDALRQRRARGLDVSIIIGGAEPINGTDKEQKQLGFAPEGSTPTEEDAMDDGDDDKMEGGDGVTPLQHPDEMQDKMLIQNELDKMGLGKSSMSAQAKMKSMATKGA